MKNFFINILRIKLAVLSRLTIRRYKPMIIGVTGSVGKTSTKLAIAAVLSGTRRVRPSFSNLNNELGLPLAILGDWSPRELSLVSRDTPAGRLRVRKFLFWIKIIFSSFWRLIKKDENYPEVLVLEYGADRPGDIKKLLRIARPVVSVITAVGKVPVHLEYYSGPEAVAREKARLIDCLPPSGFAVLNNDDPTVMNLAPRTRAKVLTFGSETGAEVKVSHFENWIERNAADHSDWPLDEKPAGIGFRLEFGGDSVPVHIRGAFGRAQAYSAAAAAAVGLIFGLDLVKISEALAEYHPADSRMQLLRGMKHSYIINDSYNASPLSMRSALETLAGLPAGRRVAVLGDMLEIGKYAPEAHEEVGRLAAKSSDVIFTVGPRAEFIADSARKQGIKPVNIFSFKDASEAAEQLKKEMREGDLILVKGSHAMQLDKLVSEIKYVEPLSSSPV